MRNFMLIFALLLTFSTPAPAEETYVNARYGATAMVPSGFEPMGPEAANSDGLIFRSRDGSILTIYGDDVPGGDFAAFVDSRIAFEESYNGWNVTGKTVTPDWAEYSGSIGGRFLSVRMLSTCNGRQAVATKFEYSGSNMRATASKVEASLRAGPASSC